MTHAGLPLFPDDAGRPPGDATPAADSPYRPPPPATDSAGEPPAAENTLSTTPAAPSPADVLAEECRWCDREMDNRADKHCSRVATQPILQRLLAAGVATTDDLRYLPTPFGNTRKFLGSIGLGPAKLRIVERAEYVPSRDRANHAHPIRRWVLVDRAEAVRLLAELRADLQESGGGSSPVG